jgi:ketosteroid isomerase-like protein
MSERNVELVRSFFDAYNARDAEAVDRMLDPDARLTTLTARAGLARQWTPGTTRQYFKQLDETMADVRAEIEDYRELGEHVVALGVIRGAGRSSHIEVGNPFATVFVVRNSRFVLVETYNNWDDALEAAGLSDD